MDSVDSRRVLTLKRNDLRHARNGELASREKEASVAMKLSYSVLSSPGSRCLQDNGISAARSSGVRHVCGVSTHHSTCRKRPRHTTLQCFL